MLEKGARDIGLYIYKIITMSELLLADFLKLLDIRTDVWYNRYTILRETKYRNTKGECVCAYGFAKPDGKKI